MEKIEIITDDEIKKVFRCPECNLVPIINYYLKESEKEDSEEIYEQKINIICRNNHSRNNIDLDEFLESYIFEENKKNDSICIKHNKKIEKICEKCNLNLFEECKHECDNIIDIIQYVLTKKEKEYIKENIKKFHTFFKKIKNIIKNNDKYQLFYEKK